MGQQQPVHSSESRNIYTNIPLPEQEKDEEGHMLHHYTRNKVSQSEVHDAGGWPNPLSDPRFNDVVAKDHFINSTLVLHSLHYYHTDSGFQTPLDPNGEVYTFELRAKELVLPIPQHRQYLLYFYCYSFG